MRRKCYTKFLRLHCLQPLQPVQSSSSCKNRCLFASVVVWTRVDSSKCVNVIWMHVNWSFMIRYHVPLYKVVIKHKCVPFYTHNLCLKKKRNTKERKRGKVHGIISDVTALNRPTQAFKPLNPCCNSEWVQKCE